MLTGLLDLFLDFANHGFRYISVPDNEDYLDGGKLTRTREETISINPCNLLLSRV